jgi:hypothetical protein
LSHRLQPVISYKPFKVLFNLRELFFERLDADQVSWRWSVKKCLTTK